MSYNDSQQNQNTRHGGYRHLKCFKNATIIFDATKLFCKRFIKTHSRTIDQMVQAARSGKQNICEGSVDSAVSKTSEIYLTGVARGSLQELLEDFEDFLREKKLPLWQKEDSRVREVRQFVYKAEEQQTYEAFMQYARTCFPEAAANVIITLIHQTNYLLDHLIKRQIDDFTKNGGMKEKLYNWRKEYKMRNRTDRTDRTR